MAGYEITRAENGDEALEAALATPFDLAVLDIMVPGISGIEVLEELRQQRPDIAVIMLSALEDEATQLREIGRASCRERV